MDQLPQNIPARVEMLNDGKITLKVPDDPDAYRLFARLYDGKGLAGRANIPFLVQSGPDDKARGILLWFILIKAVHRR